MGRLLRCVVGVVGGTAGAADGAAGAADGGAGAVEGAAAAPIVTLTPLGTGLRSISDRLGALPSREP